MNMPVIETPRLLIRPFAAGDLPALAPMFDACFGAAPMEDRVRWLEWTVRNVEALYALKQPPYGDRAVVLKQDGALVGSIGLVPSLGPFETLPYFRNRLTAPSRGGFTPEVGMFWAITPSHRGMGIATEAARALAEFAFTSLALDRLVATTEHINLASIAVMKRLGMSVETNPLPEPSWFQVIGILANPIQPISALPQRSQTGT